MTDRAPGLRHGSPAEAGLSAGHLDRARELAAGWVEDGTHPALEVLVARHGVIALHEAFGRHGPGPDAREFKCGDLTPTASMIKPVTAAALMCLVEDGMVGLTRPVRQYIPEFSGEGRDAVCVHHLLTHTSGLYQDVAVTVREMMESLGQPRRFRGVHRVVDGYLQAACAHPLVGPPGKEMRYDTLNYELAGEIVRRVSGRPFQEFAAERILAPLELNDTWFALPEDMAERVVTAEMRASLSTPTALVGIGSTSGTGTYSTALDMARFCQMFLDGGEGPGGRVLHPSTVAAMSVNQIPGIPGGFPEEWHEEASWSFGWGVACHEKWTLFPHFTPGTLQHMGGTGTMMSVDPATGLVCVYMSLADFRRPDGSLPDDELLAGTLDDLYLDWNADLFAQLVQAAVED
ncbi:MAG TPA: serine hydrolase domain-containing protein [Acidimicrobiales bacterium]|nr:serine hydrolase domain-containing protein [Acidimicrobiales bacterium]